MANKQTFFLLSMAFILVILGSEKQIDGLLCRQERLCFYLANVPYYIIKR